MKNWAKFSAVLAFNPVNYYLWTPKTPLLCALLLGTLAVVTPLYSGQDVVLMDEPDIYWTMGTLTEDEDGIFAERGEDVNGEPLHITFQADGELPTIVDSIVPIADDGAVMFDAAEGQSLSIPNSPFTNDTPDNVGVANRTYELWFQPRNLPTTGADNRQIIYEEGGTTRGLAIYLDGTQDDDPTEANLYIMTTNLAEDVWGGTTGPLETDPEFAVSVRVEKGKTYHLVYVIDKPDDVQEDLNGDLIGYLNGVEFGRVDNKVGLWFDHTDAAGIGRPYADTVFHDGIVAGANASGLYFYDGIVDEFAVYEGKSLTAQQIELHYLTGIDQEKTLIGDFNGDAARLASGQPLTLTWEVSAFEDLTIDNDVGDVSGITADGKGTITVNPTETTTYILTATQGEFSQSRSVSVFVGLPVIRDFTISSESIRAGTSANLSWSVSGDTSVTIEPNVGDLEGVSSISVSPDNTTTYTLTATNEIGSTTAEVTLTIAAELLPDLGWTASALEDGEIFEWNPSINSTTNDGILWEGGDGGTVESGASNFATITKWVNSPSFSLTSNPNDSWQDGLGGPVTQANVSWEMVFRPGDFDGLHTLFNTGGNGDGTAFVLDGSVLDFRFQDADSDDQRVIATADLAEIGTATDFYHVVGLADIDSNDTGTATIYVNGLLLEEVTSVGTINDWDGGDLAELGTGNNIPGGNPFDPDPFTGDIALFNYYQGIILSGEQVTSLYQAQAGASGGFLITRIEYVPATNSVQLTWNSTPGLSYAVDSVSNLGDAWGELSDGVPAADDGTETTFIDTFTEGNPMKSALYYRIRLE
ncbi:MAG: hypothetical protein ACI9R3_000350 [Verrucomicrobiales bacterium]